MATAQIGTATAAPVQRDRTRSPHVRAREAERRTMRALKYAPAPLDLDALAYELGATVGVTAR